MAGLLDFVLPYLQSRGLLAGPVGAPSLGLLGSGMAEQAAQIMQSRPYQLHVQEMKALGQQPMTPDQFLAQQNAQPR